MLSSCADAPSIPPNSTRDSAGVTIVESAAPAWDAGNGWTVDREPLLDLSTAGTGEAHEFYSVQDAIRLADGSLVVGARAGDIRIFSASGSFLGSVGGRGEGPGEFQMVTSLHVTPGDSILAFDGRARRVTVIGPDRTVERIVPIALPLPRRFTPLDRVTWLVAVPPLDDDLTPDARIYRTPMPVIRVSREGALRDTVATVAGPEGVFLEVSSGLADARPIFGRDAHLAVRGGRFLLGSAETMEYRIHAPDGSLERIVRVPDYDLTLDEGMLDAERAARLGMNSSPGSRELLSLLPTPSARPAYSELRVDSEGCVWAAEHNGEFVHMLGPEPRDWEVFGPDDAWLGSVRLPARFNVLDIGRDYVLGVFRDDLDVERVQMLRLHRND